MKKQNLIILIAVLFTTINTQGQASFKPGLRGGLSFSTISEMNANYRTSFYVGGFGEMNITKRYALQPEIDYNREGAKNVVRIYNDGTQERITHDDLKLDYLSFSLINKFTFGPGFQVLFGPSLDILLNDNLEYRKSSNDYAFITGIGYRTSSGLAFEIRFKKGFNDVLESSYYQNNASNGSLFGDYNANNNFQLGISYSFGK